MSFNHHRMISRSYDFQAHQQHSKRWCLSQTALLWFGVLPDWSPELLDLSPGLPGLSLALRGLSPWFPVAPRHAVGAPRLVTAAPRCPQVHPKFSPVLRRVPKPLTITPMVLLYQSSEIPVTLKASRNPLLGSETLPKLSHVSLHSTYSQTLLVDSSDENILCWCLQESGQRGLPMGDVCTVGSLTTGWRSVQQGRRLRRSRRLQQKQRK